jgi:hypothetical protein
MHKNICFDWWAGVARITAVALFLCPLPYALAADGKGFGFSPDKVSQGTDVPQVEISLGMRPYANDLIFVAGIKQGFYKDIGLTITPAPCGRRLWRDLPIPRGVKTKI